MAKRSAPTEAVVLPHRCFDLPLWTPSRIVQKSGRLEVSLGDGSFVADTTSPYGLPDHRDWEMVYRLLVSGQTRIEGISTVMEAAGLEGWDSRDVQWLQRWVDRVAKVRYHHVETTEDSREDYVFGLVDSCVLTRERDKIVLSLRFGDLALWFQQRLWRYKLDLRTFHALRPTAARLYELIAVHLHHGTHQNDGVVFWGIGAKRLRQRLGFPTDTTERRLRRAVRTAMDDIAVLRRDYHSVIQSRPGEDLYVFGRSLEA